jgi:3'(2'), 5'-bisphosphate nucleotidase
MCLLAKGDGDIYIRLGPTSEWDTAAGHAILKGVGGGIFKNTEPFEQELQYNSKDSMKNPEFIAIKTLDLLEML